MGIAPHTLLKRACFYHYDDFTVGVRYHAHYQPLVTLRLSSDPFRFYVVNDRLNSCILHSIIGLSTLKTLENRFDTDQFAKSDRLRLATLWYMIRYDP